MRRYITLILLTFSLAFSSAAFAGDYEKGRVAYDVGDFEKATAIWAPAAESGDAGSQFGMGLLYANGYGVPLDDAMALKWYGLAAEQGHGEAQCALGVMHANGWGVPMSESEAMKWYLLAAENGVTDAQINLGTMYQNGFSIEKNEVEALKWFTIAARLEDPDAASKRDYLAERLPSETLAAADELVNAWFTDHQTMLANR
jgi:TPR repeat protein